MEDIHYRPIGVIYSPFKEPSGMPIQPAGAEDIEGTIELFDEFTASLKNLDGFSHITLIYHFHLAKKTSLELSPYMDNTEKRGVFATRAPSRPNPIGISVVKLIKIENHILHIKNVDIVDGTPLLDIKPKNLK